VPDCLLRGGLLHFGTCHSCASRCRNTNHNRTDVSTQHTATDTAANIPTNHGCTDVSADHPHTDTAANPSAPHRGTPCMQRGAVRCTVSGTRVWLERWYI
jgi:hypothetical protein